MNKIKNIMKEVSIRLYILINTIYIKLVELQLRRLVKEDTKYQKTIHNLIKTYIKRYSYETIRKASKKNQKRKGVK